jgi:hypothetical protein
MADDKLCAYEAYGSRQHRRERHRGYRCVFAVTEHGSLPKEAGGHYLSLLKTRCIDGQCCSAAEFAIFILLWVIRGGVSVRAALLGWQGRLWGARAQR